MGVMFSTNVLLDGLTALGGGGVGPWKECSETHIPAVLFPELNFHRTSTGPSLNP